MIKYFIEDYYTGLTILDDNGYYTRYFDTLDDTENFLYSLGHLNEEDNFFILEESEGKTKTVEY